MNPGERKAAIGLAGIFGLRMLGLFFILPVFTLYADNLAGSTPTLIGVAIGAYGLTQAILQVPMGMVSDRIGRKPVIIGGLAVFALGSVVAALSGSIYGVIAGRALQGCGAIAAAVMALAADVTREQQRTKIMAIIGMSVGLAFMIALIVAPSVAAWMGLSGIFWVTAALAVIAMALLYLFVPQIAERSHDRDIRPGTFRQVLRNPDLLRLDFSVMALHTILTASFVVLPVVIENQIGLPRPDHWEVYVPVMVASVLFLFPAIGVGEAKKIMHRVVAASVLLLVLGEIGLADSLYVGPWAVVIALLVHFTAFNILESSLPSLISRFSPPQAKGAALGVFSTCQFIGAFVGGSLGGYLFGRFGAEGVFVFAAIVAACWFLMALGLRSPDEARAAQGQWREA
ncbi:MAG TPA: MFS transporter [Gammaproteobacteria bacterium]|nr:MFS transporter [Gammaproteobacteria bacterium]